ncbi:MAG: membrane protein insertase YidC, partial [Terriglobales bacterium]
MTEYRNPQTDPGSEKKMMLAFVIVFGLIIALQYFLPKPQAPKSQPAGPQQSQQQPAGTPAAAATSATPAASATQASAATAGAPKVPVKMAEAETESVLENDFYRITFTNRGAQVKSWELIETHKDRGGKPIAGNYKYKGEKDKPINLVNAVAAQQLGLPLSFFSYDKELEKKLNQAMYQASVSGRVDAHEPLVFEFSDGDIVARKVFRTDGGYAVSVETEVLNRGQRVQAFPQWPGGLGDQVTPAAFGGGLIDWRKDGAIERKAATSGWFLTGKKWVANGDTVSGPFEWAAAVDQYFAAVFMPDSAKDTAIVTLNNPIEIPKNPASPGEGKDKVSVLGLAFGNITGLTRTSGSASPAPVAASTSYSYDDAGRITHLQHLNS